MCSLYTILGAEEENSTMIGILLYHPLQGDAHLETILHINTLGARWGWRTGFLQVNPGVEEIECEHCKRDHCTIKYVCTITDYDSRTGDYE